MSAKSMRRKDRAVTDSAQICETVKQMDTIRIGFFDGEEVYIVPLSFGFCEEDGKYTFYMHGAKVGRKVDLIKSCGKAGFELDKAIEVVTDTEPCDHTVLYKSVIGHGVIEEVTDLEEKKQGLNAIMLQNTGKGDWEFPDMMIKATFVMKLTPDWLTCKIHE